MTRSFRVQHLCDELKLHKWICNILNLSSYYEITVLFNVHIKIWYGKVNFRVLNHRPHNPRPVKFENICRLPTKF